MKDAERGRPIENYGKKEQKEWLDNTLPDPHPVQQGTRRKSTDCFKNAIPCLRVYCWGD